MGNGATISDGGVVNPGAPGVVTFNTFSGTDMKVFFGPNLVGSLLAITIGVTREKAPIYTSLGTNPRGFTRGKRAISGSMTFGQFDRHALLYGPFYDLTERIGLYSNIGAPSGIPPVGVAGDTARAYGTTAAQYGQGRAVVYADQLPPFDVVITFTNDAGAAAVFKVVGVEIVSEGYGFTLDDMTQEMACSYMAREVMPMAPVAAPSAAFSENFWTSMALPTAA